MSFSEIMEFMILTLLLKVFLNIRFRSLTAHAADPSKILSCKVLRISSGPKLSELSKLYELFGFVAPWLCGCLAP